jgi:uncharacterized protein DUF6448
MKATFLLPFTITSVLALVPAAARAHCDTLDGPVVVTARAALENGRVEPVLAWVAPGDEAEIRQAFARVRSVRKGGKEARELADRWFFETVVRVHRAGEGAPFTGLKSAETPEPAMAAVDAVAAGGDAKRVEELLVRAMREGLHAHLARLVAQKPPASDVAAGRRWVAAYVPFVHWAEAVHTAATGAGGHGSEHDDEHVTQHETAAAESHGR